jgi:class 3 adenylate cyclase
VVTTRMAAFLFCDLADSTALQSRLGDEAAGHVRRTVHAALGEAVVLHHGHEIKNLGDGLMASFTSAADALGSAIAMQQEIGRLRARSGHDLRLRVGISAGEATLEDGDWFGTPVVEAARLCARAAPEQVLVSEVAQSLLSPWRRHRFVSVGELELKGLPAPLTTACCGWPSERSGKPPVTAATPAAPCGWPPCWGSSRLSPTGW